MNTTSNRPPFHHKRHLYILRRLAIAANLVCLSTYILLRIIFYDLPFVFGEELVILLKIIGWATGTAVALSFLIFAVDGIAYLIRYRKQIKFSHEHAGTRAVG